LELSIGRILFATFLMALVTYLPRMLPIVVFQRKINNRFIKSFLAYVPYAVLAAMTFPEILYATSSIVSAVAGLLAALVLSYYKRGLLTVALGSTAAVLLTEWCLQFV
jgi:branched-subunit amino acid transport protein